MRRHKHNLSHYRLLTCDMGELVPVGVVEVLPGDTFQHRTAALIRVSPLVAPVMHPVQVRVHHFFVPNRLVWSGWEDFITGENAVDDVPTLSVDATNNRLTDFMGIPPVTGVTFNALPVRAYNLIYNEWYRDQDLVTAVGEDSLLVQKVAWGKDYFTAARPWPQKGGAVTVPLGEQAPITGIGMQWTTGGGGEAPLNPPASHETGGIDKDYTSGWDTGVNNIIVAEDPDNANYPDIWADLSSAEGVNVNDLRKAFALQRYQEARARYGSRYTEYLRYLGVRSSDARLQRPEYLGGGRQTIAFSEVLQTAPDATSNVGDLLGHGIAAMRTRRYRRFFEEHGHVISLMSVRPKGMYANSLHRKFLRRKKEDFYQRELEAIGQQEVTTQEIYAANPDPGTVFGYVDRYREYREEPSFVSTDFRSTFDYWHLARNFGSAPALNQTFVDCEPSKRIHAVQTDDVLWCMVRQQIAARRLVNRSAHARIL